MQKAEKIRDTEAQEESSRDLEAFVYAVSHDMSAPIRAVSGFSRLILDRASASFDDKTREQFGYIIRAGEEMQGMLSALTEYSRLITRPNPPADATAGKLVAMVLDGFREALRECGAVVELDVQEGLTLHGDIPRLMHMVECLIANAIAYRHQDRALRLHITGWEDKGSIHLSIIDNGIGLSLSEETKERIFRPFGRLHRQEDYPGIGMGLTIARKIAQMHGGTLEVESAHGEGCRFTAVIPCSSLS